MSKRAKATVSEIGGSHAVYVSKPEVVARSSKKATQGVWQLASRRRVEALESLRSAAPVDSFSQCDSSEGPRSPQTMSAGFAEALQIAALQPSLRSDLKPARTSSEKSFGCSRAAKWPPFSTLL